MALVSHSPPPSASLYPASSGIYSHSPAAEVRAPLVAAPKVGTTSSGTRPASSASREGGNHDPKRDESVGGRAAINGLAAATAVLELTEGLERQPASADSAGRSATLQQPARGYSAHSERSPSKADATARAGSAVPSLRTGPLPGFQSRSASTPTASSPCSSVPPSSSFRSTSPTSIQHAAGNIYSASAAASSSTSFVPAPTPAPTTPLNFSSAGASPTVSTSPQSYFAVATSDQQQRFANNGPTQFSGQIPYPPHSSGYPNPAFPFLPSPHPGVPHMTAFGGSQVGMPSPQFSQDQHALFLQYQQQWQMEMLKSQQQQANARSNESGARRRATSGPTAQQPQVFYSVSPSYPPSPAPSLQKQVLHAGLPAPSLPTLPPGAMLPQYATHGYPTPPTSQESSSRGESGTESSASSSGSAPSRTAAGEAYHPYRRDEHRRHGNGAQGTSSEGGRSQHAHRATSPSGGSSVASRGHARLDSGASSQFPASPQAKMPPPLAPPSAPRSASSSSVTSLSSHAAAPTPRASGLSAPAADSPPFPRSRTSSQTSATPSAGSRAGPGLRQRHDSSESGRSSTPVQLRARTSPLSAVPHNESEDDGAKSDATAEATATVNAGLSASSTLTSLAEPKAQEKGGMKSRFRKAFGVSNSPSVNTLTEADLAGEGPRQVQAGWRPRTDSDNSSNVSNPPRLPYDTHAAGSVSGGASILNDAASTTTSRRPPSSNRFRLLNGKFNGSSDNLSISSTVSSASMMIRKIGQMGKLARRNSLMGLTKAFKKDKNKDDDDPAVERGVAATAKLTKKDKKKSGVASASVSHATAESGAYGSQATAGMSPAAALARQQQLAYAEREAAEERARQAAAAEAARLGPPKRSFEQLPSHQRANSAASDASSITSGQTPSDKKSRKGFGFKNRFGLGGSKTDLREAASFNDAASTYSTYSAMEPTSGQYDDATPRQSVEVLAPPQMSYSSYGAHEYGTDSQEYEPSLYREGAEPKQFARPPRGILKGAGTYRQEDYVQSRPQYARNRASSFDATQQQPGPTVATSHTALVNAIPSEQQVDGITTMQTDHRADIHAPTDREVLSDAVAARVHPETVSSGPYSHTGMNASAPALNHFASLPALRPTSPAAPKRRIVFASSLSVHTTWPANIYDRRAEPATCNRLTPLLAQQIKEELNSFKMEEMDVHPLSRRLTHFFV